MRHDHAARHGRDPRGEARIAVAIDADADGSFTLSVEDEGPGFVAGEPRRRFSGLGLVQGLAAQLGGSLVVTRGVGARCTVRFGSETTRNANS